MNSHLVNGAQQGSPAPDRPSSMTTLAFEFVLEERDKLYALVAAVERLLGEACNEGKEPPDDAPLHAWRLSQVAVGILESNQHDRSLASFLGLTDKAGTPS